MASKWLHDDAAPIPFSSWSSSRGDDVRANQWSLLAIASTLLPETAVVSLSINGAVTTKQDTNWKATHFKNLHLTITSGEVNFTRCVFSRSRIDVPKNWETVIRFKECKYDSTEIHFEAFPSWITNYDVEGEKAVDVPIAAWIFSEAVEQGARVFVEQSEWQLPETHLKLFLEAARHLKGKTEKRYFAQGFYENELKNLLPRLLQTQLVIEDQSRKSHHLELSSAGRELIAMLKRDPVKGQQKVAALFGGR